MFMELVAKNVVKAYGQRCAVNCAELSIKQGEILGLVGPNGSGKSTLLKLISGRLTQTSGHFSLTNTGVAANNKTTFSNASTAQGNVNQLQLAASQSPIASQALRNLVYLAGQNDDYCAHLSVIENLFLGQEQYRRLCGLKVLHWRKMRTLGENLLASIGAENIALGAPMHTLSGGQKKLITLARAALSPCPILCFDEPTNHLGITQTKIFQRMLNQKKQAGASIILSGHNPSQMKSITDKIYAMNNGQILKTLETCHASENSIAACMAGA